MARILGLDLGTNSIGWALISYEFGKKEGKIHDMGVRIIPMDQGELGKFDAGQSISQTAERTDYRGTRRLYQRANLRRERLHRVLNILGFLPKHYADHIDFEKKLGKFKPNKEVKLNYRKNEGGQHEFIFMDTYKEMMLDFKKEQPNIFYTKKNGKESKIPFDWTIYYLRKKALSEAISKEELAWVILNFNQKRGYYQLRGEEIEDTSNKEFVQLKVAQVVDSGEEVKGNALFDVIFENGWKYDRQITKTEDWIDRTKEFIVTTKVLNNGDIKRSYKTVDSEKDWAAIKAKTEQEIKNANKTVGAFIYDSLLKNPKQKIRGKLVKTIERKYYKEELKKIIRKQIELQPHLFSDKHYQASIKELYPHNEAHRNNIAQKGFEYLFIDDIIFYQRPLKSQKGNIAGCQYENRYFTSKNKKSEKEEILKKPLQAISKSHPLFQEFRIWQWLYLLKIYNKDSINNGQIMDVTHELLPTENDWVALFDFLHSKKELDQKQFLEYFVKRKKITKADINKYRWNYPEDKKYPFAETRAQFISRLSKVKNITNAEEFLDQKTKLGSKENSPTLSRLEQLWHIVYSVSDLKEFKSALNKYALKHNIDSDSFVASFIKFPPFKSDYGSYSHKAISKLLPLMRKGHYWDEQRIPNEIKDRAANIMERVNDLPLGETYTRKELTEALAQVSDDDIPKQLVKSFLPFRDKNPLKGLNTYQAAYLVYDRYAEVGEIQNWKHSFEITQYLRNFKQHSLRNPIVERVVTETLRVVQDLWEYYGEKESIDYTLVYDDLKKKKVKSYSRFFDEIHVELGRELKNPASKREKISKQIAQNENTNHRIREVLKELKRDSSVQGDIRDYSPSHQDLLKIYEEGIYQNPNTDYTSVSEDEIQKIRKKNNPTPSEIQRYRLWLEQGYVSPYTGQPIKLSDLFTEKYQIEHIIPRARYFDNSLSNKIICESDVNEDKDNKTAYEYFKTKEGDIVAGHKLLTLDQYKEHVNRYFKHNRQKLKNLLSEDIPEGFINRQLNDSRYISKLVKNLLSNIVRQADEQEATAKKLIPITGAVTSRLRQDWGLNDKWNEIILPRFERLNQLTESNDFTTISREGHLIPTVPDELLKGFSKKRIDHRHHALDALVVACTMRDHTHYLSALNAESENYSLRDKLLLKNKKGKYTKTFQMPWGGFPVDAKNEIEKTVISFKQNLRVINKATNTFWSYKDENGQLNIGKDGKPKKKLRKQTKGDDHWAIRKPLHKETVSGIYHIDTPKGKIATSVRTALAAIKNKKHLAKICDERIREVILPNHLKNYVDDKGKIDYAAAFNQEGIEDLNNNIVMLNDGKKHQPIYKVKMYEVGSKFTVSENPQSAKSKKYVEAAKGTNLYFAVYWDERKQKRNYETVPLNEVIAHQKQVAHLPKDERQAIQPNPQLGEFLFTLSPNDLVYVPTENELDQSENVDFDNLANEQLTRIYKMEKTSGKECYFIKHSISNLIYTYDSKTKFGELGSQNKLTTTMTEDRMKIVDYCIKLKVDRLGNISKA